MIKRKLLCAITLLAAGAAGQESTRDRAWNVMSIAIDSGGIDGHRALELLASVDDERGRKLLRSIFSGVNGSAISAVAKGLNAFRCVQYLSDLRKAVLNPAVEPKIQVVAAIGRAGTLEAAQTLADVADQSSELVAGVAFGSLERMGIVAEAILERQLTTARSAKSRETAAHVLRRIGAVGAANAYRRALSDSDNAVRIAAALGLAQLGLSDGVRQLDVAAEGNGIDYQVEAITALAMLGRSSAIEKLKALARSSSESVRGKTAWAIARSGNAKLKAIAYELNLDKNPHFRSMLVEKLLNPNDPQDLRVLRSAASDPNEISALIAARRLLGTSSAHLAVSAIVRGLRSKDDHVRLLALTMASENATAAQDLMGRIADSHPLVKAAAISAIAAGHHSERFDEIEAYLRSTSSEVSLSAARALLSLNDQRARQVLEANLNSPLGHVRLHSAAMLLEGR